MIELGRTICNEYEAATSREWLVTNGIGGYAAGTVSGVLTRCYHGLLLAALEPPLGRTLLLTKLDETAVYNTITTPLFSNHWSSGIIEPQGFQYLKQFHLEGTTPVWTYALADALLEKRIWMQPGANTTYIQYTLRRGSYPVTLNIKALVNYRDHHDNTHSDDWTMQVQPVANGLQINAIENVAPFYLLTDRAEAVPQHEWYTDYQLSVEAYRGLDEVEDHLYAGDFQATLSVGESLTFVASTESASELDGQVAKVERRIYEQALLSQSALVDSPPAIEQLILAADQFVVRRATAKNPDGYSVIAGYPWFSDWGRDTMISLSGLTLATGRPAVGRQILQTFADFVDKGMLPNRFPDVGSEPEYNTVDATLWYFEAIRAYHAVTGDDDLLRELLPVLQDIVAWHRRGTRYNIHQDLEDGLLVAGQAGVQLTWMDAKVDDWVVTPRIGKPVEINALWYNALCILNDFMGVVGQSGQAYDALAQQVKRSFARFWNDEAGCCYDLLDGTQEEAALLRPNQLLAVSLTHSPLNDEQQRAVVAACTRHLLTPYGLRSLSPNEEGYNGRYGGDRYSRDAVYHQGTVWGWLIGPFIGAHLRVYNDPVAARTYLEPLLHHLAEYGLGNVSEIFDGDAPFTARGCFAQAWSVAELLRAWQMTTIVTNKNE